MNSISKIFVRGFFTLLPIALTIYIVYSAIKILENILGSLLREILPHYIPGLGFIATLICIFVFGLFLNRSLSAKIVRTIEEKLTQVPFIKAIYSPLRDLMNLFNRNHSQSMKGVVLVQMGESGVMAMGVVTRESFSDLPFYDQVPHHVAVYFPLSYGLGGYTLLIPKDRVRAIDIPVEKAMSLAITGWVKADPQSQNTSSSQSEPLVKDK